MSSYTPSPTFNNAAAYLSNSSSAGRASNNIKLELYGLFKFLTVAVKPTTSKPSIFDMTGRAKWDAWAATGGKYTAPEEAEKRYIEIAKELGWDEATAGPEASKPEPKEDISDDAALLDSDEESGKPSSSKPRENQGSKDGSGGLGVSVSSMARPQDTVDDSIHGIAVEGNVENLKFLLAVNPGINIDRPDEYGYTALHLACDRGHLEVVKLLLEKGANKDIQDPDEFTPLELAKVAGREDIVALLS